ncbi:hypothetical protein [Brevundimonas sp.]|uniref:hypothetical protein n=1 Tax=Brevundimonas sp. TaxID=1871086 RepID=UPI0025BEE75A|nr:hypothetical protein [Brevundimonas sp.]
MRDRVSALSCVEPQLLGKPIVVPVLPDDLIAETLFEVAAADGRLPGRLSARRGSASSKPLNAAYRLYRSGRRQVQSAAERAFTTWLRREMTISIDAFNMLTACPVSGRPEPLTAVGAL